MVRYSTTMNVDFYGQEDVAYQPTVAASSPKRRRKSRRKDCSTADFAVSQEDLDRFGPAFVREHPESRKSNPCVISVAY